MALSVERGALDQCLAKVEVQRTDSLAKRMWTEFQEALVSLMSKSKTQVTAYWGNDDAESTIKMSSARLAALLNGGSHAQNAWGYYEGRRFSVRWTISEGTVNIDGDDGKQCVLEGALDELIVNEAH